jgi:hypothetical protein
MSVSSPDSKAEGVGQNVSSTFGMYSWAEAEPNRLALITEKGAIAFGQLGARVNQPSHALHSPGPGMRV